MYIVMQNLQIFATASRRSSINDVCKWAGRPLSLACVAEMAVKQSLFFTLFCLLTCCSWKCNQLVAVAAYMHGCKFAQVGSLCKISNPTESSCLVSMIFVCQCNTPVCRRIWNHHLRWWPWLPTLSTSCFCWSVSSPEPWLVSQWPPRWHESCVSSS